jgi:hypothetical protein
MDWSQRIFSERSNGQERSCQTQNRSHCPQDSVYEDCRSRIKDHEDDHEDDYIGATKQEIKQLKQQDVSSTRNALQLAQRAEESGLCAFRLLQTQDKRNHKCVAASREEYQL